MGPPTATRTKLARTNEQTDELCSSRSETAGYGGGGRNRTADKGLMRPLLWPSELHRRAAGFRLDWRAADDSKGLRATRVRGISSSDAGL